MTQSQLDSATGRGRFFRRLARSLVLLDRQAGQLTDQAGLVMLGEVPRQGDVRRGGGLVESLYDAVVERGSKRA